MLWSLGHYCVARKKISNGTSSLSEISLRLLGHRISKDLRESDWSTYSLTDDQIRYAVIDTWASLAIYHAVNSSPVVGARITQKNCFPETHISLQPHGLKKPLASGRIIEGYDSSSKSTTIEITSVRVPGYMYKQANQQHEATLGSYKKPPFQLKVLVKDLLTAKVTPTSTTNARQNNSSTQETQPDNNNGADCPTDSPTDNFIETHIDKVFTKMFGGNEGTTVNQACFTHGYKQFMDLIGPSKTSKNERRLYTRVVKDIFHLMDMVNPYERHGIYKEFTRKFRDTPFEIDETDKENVKRLLLNMVKLGTTVINMMLGGF